MKDPALKTGIDVIADSISRLIELREEVKSISGKLKMPINTGDIDRVVKTLIDIKMKSSLIDDSLKLGDAYNREKSFLYKYISNSIIPSTVIPCGAECYGCTNKKLINKQDVSDDEWNRLSCEDKNNQIKEEERIEESCIKNTPCEAYLKYLKNKAKADAVESAYKKTNLDDLAYHHRKIHKEADKYENRWTKLNSLQKEAISSLKIMALDRVLETLKQTENETSKQ